MGMKEEVMGLAEEVEATVGGCVSCIADKPGGRCLSEDTFECSDAICREVAKRLRAIVEHGAEDVSVSACDLLSDEDRKALAWVREMGGVEVAKACITHAKPEPDSWERIEEDARLMPSEYTDRYRVGRIGFEAEDMKVDLVRRCRALAERGA